MSSDKPNPCTVQVYKVVLFCALQHVGAHTHSQIVEKRKHLESAIRQNGGRQMTRKLSKSAVMLGYTKNLGDQEQQQYFVFCEDKSIRLVRDEASIAYVP